MEGEPLFNSSSKKALNAIIKGCCEAASIKVDDIAIPGPAKRILHGVLKSVEETANEELVRTQLLLPRETAATVTRPKEEEPTGMMVSESSIEIIAPESNRNEKSRTPTGEF